MFIQLRKNTDSFPAPILGESHIDNDQATPARVLQLAYDFAAAHGLVNGWVNVMDDNKNMLYKIDIY